MTKDANREDHDEPGPPSAPPSTAARPLIALVRWYQLAREGHPSPCRFVPTCSTYAIEALQEYGPAKGTWLATRRLGRCHPWGGGGYDPVPTRSTWNTVETHVVTDGTDHPDPHPDPVADSIGPDQKVP